MSSPCEDIGTHLNVTPEKTYRTLYEAVSGRPYMGLLAIGKCYSARGTFSPNLLYTYRCALSTRLIQLLV